MRLDVLVRKHVRKWLRLPYDLHHKLFEADDREEGLSIMCLRHSVPILQSHRLEKFKLSQIDPLVIALIQTSVSHANYRRLLLARNVVYSEVCSTSNDIKRVVRSTLYMSADGMGPITFQPCPNSAAVGYAVSGSGQMSIHNYICVIQIWAGVYHTKLRHS